MLPLLIKQSPYCCFGADLFNAIRALIINIGAEIAIDEYVPSITPNSIAKLKPRRPLPPNMYIISTTNRTDVLVRRVLERVALILSFIS